MSRGSVGPIEYARRLGPARARLALVGLAVVAAWLGMGYRLFEIQVVRAADLAEEGLSQRLVSRDLAPQRGKIFDRNGELLALTVDSESVYAVPDQVEDPLWVAQQVGGLLGVDSGLLQERLAGDRQFVYLKRQVEPEVAERITSLDLRGVYTHTEPKRIYPAGHVASHVTGFVDIDGAGQEGLELYYDSELTGVPGQAVFERDLGGRPIPQGISDIVPAKPGADLHSTLDLPLQYQAQQACGDAVARTGALSCWVVALGVETGEILAMAGAPRFDPQTRATDDPRCERSEDEAACRMFSNFVIRGIYEPGSTQKLVTFAAALEEGEVGVETVIPDVSDVLELREGACRSSRDDLHGCYRDFNEHQTKDMTVGEIFTRSSNVGTIKVASKVGQERLIDYIEAFGLGSKSGVDYTAEATGLLNFEAGCETCWASAAIGYSVAATPLQMAAAFATVGNDGVWTSPHLVASRADLDGVVDAAKPETRRVIGERTAELMRRLLTAAVEDGTGGNAAVEGYRVGGKTGTANKLDSAGRYTDETRASFVGMAPMTDPKVVVAVVVDRPSDDFRTGGEAAAPVFAEVMEHALHRMAVTPDATGG